MNESNLANLRPASTDRLATEIINDFNGPSNLSNLANLFSTPMRVRACAHGPSFQVGQVGQVGRGFEKTGKNRVQPTRQRLDAGRKGRTSRGKAMRGERRNNPGDIGAAVAAIADRVDRLTVSRHDPHACFEQRSEIAADLRAAARVLPAPADAGPEERNLFLEPAILRAKTDG